MYEFKTIGESDELEEWATASSEEEKTSMLKRLALEFDFIDTWEVFKNGEHVETVQAQSLLPTKRQQQLYWMEAHAIMTAYNR